MKEDPEPIYTRVCNGYVEFADQGIEVCETCGGCTCCDHVTVDHRNARYRCWIANDGSCALVDSKIEHDCTRDRRPEEHSTP